MAIATQVRRTTNLGLRMLEPVKPLAPLLTRLLLGAAFFMTGRGKLADPERVVGFFTELGIPWPALNAAFVSRVEYWGGLLLIVGALTRIAALLLSGTMVVALATAHWAEVKEAFADPANDVIGWCGHVLGSLCPSPLATGEAGLTDVVPLMYLALLLPLIVYGPGALSLDRALSPFLGLDRHEPDRPPTID